MHYEDRPTRVHSLLYSGSPSRTVLEQHSWQLYLEVIDDHTVPYAFIEP